MTDLSPAELAGLRTLLAPFAAAVYLPLTGEAHACPNGTIPLHHCDRQFTVPQAIERAERFKRHGIAAHVIVYGVPWVPREAPKPAQGG